MGATETSPVYKDALELLDQGRYAEAEAAFAALLRLKPSDDAAKTSLEAVRFLQGRATVPEDLVGRLVLAYNLAHRQGPVALQGVDEGPRLDQAVQIILSVKEAIPDQAKPAVAEILWRAADYATANSLGDLASLGRHSALHGTPADLLHQLAKVQTDADRAEVMHQHRLWTDRFEQAAEKQPIAHPARSPRDRLRLGFLSADLRHHVVGYFAYPLFENLDSRFDLYAYSSFDGDPDVMQRWFESRAQFRRLPGGARAAAEVIAADDLDMLVDLGGPTPQNRPAALAFKPARLQMSWLGYPQSLGFSAVDYFLADPAMAPTRPDLLEEALLTMPTSWVSMSPAAFQPRPAETPEPPVFRNGHITFGTANNTYKFNPKLVGVWAQVLAAVPTSRFMILRPEAGALSFRENIRRCFVQAGVDPDRLVFRAIRGGVRALYAEIDIALDTFPVTGGTTTCEALWMGVPTISLVGHAPYERMSWSVLSGIGLADLCVRNPEDYVRRAAELAATPGRLAELRRTMRERIKANPLGQPERFAADFYDLMVRTITKHS